MKNAYSGDKQITRHCLKIQKTQFKKLVPKGSFVYYLPLPSNWDRPVFFIFFHTPQRPAKIETRIEPRPLAEPYCPLCTNSRGDHYIP